MEENNNSQHINDNDNNNIISQTTQNSNIFNIQKICNRCKYAVGVYECSNCPPGNNIFCFECDKNFHSNPNNINHVRKDITPKIINEKKNKEVIENILSKNNDNGEFLNNYVTKLTAIYEEDKANILSENDKIKKSIYINNDLHKNKVNYLMGKMNDIEFENNKNIKLINEKNDIQKHEILFNKESYINHLVNNNRNLEEINSNLKNEVNKRSKIINNHNLVVNNKNNIYEATIKKLKEENDMIKIIYNKKIELFLNRQNIEKNKIKKDYEFIINKLNLNYSASQKNYENFLMKKTEEIKNLKNSQKDEISKLNDNIMNLKSKLDELKTNNENLLNKNRELRAENAVLQENFARTINEFEYRQNQTNENKLKLLESEREFDQVKEYNDKLNRLTHGKFKKFKSKDKI